MVRFDLFLLVRSAARALDTRCSHALICSILEEKKKDFDLVSKLLGLGFLRC